MKRLYTYLLNKLPRPLLIRLSYPFKKIAPLLYAGNKVECPVCGKTYRKFLSYGSSVAHREGVFTDPNLNVLHIAPEQCFHEKFKTQKNISYLSGDLESPIADMHFDLHSIPLEDNRFDVVFCNHVMEHVADPLVCMKELYRIMKPGGWAIMQVPQDFSREQTFEDPTITSEEDREKHYWQKDHVRLFGKDYPDYLRKAGFEVEEFSPVKILGNELIERYRLQPTEILYISHKVKA